MAAQPVRPPARRYDIAAGGLLILLAAAYFTYAALGSYLQQLKAHTAFVPLMATVVESTVASSGSATAAHGGSFAPRIVYRYNISGEDYESDRYFYVGDGWHDFASANAVKARFPVGSPVQVYADAANPSQAVLDRSKPSPGVLLYLLPFTAVGLGVLAYGLRRSGKR